MRFGCAAVLLVLLAPAPAPARAAPETPFGQELRYTVGAIEVRGNRRTDTSLVLAELGISLGDVLTPDDPRVPLAELRLRALGYFVRAELRLERLPTRRGEVTLIVEVEERGTLILNNLYLGTSRATRVWGGADVSETNLFGRGLIAGAGLVGSSRPVVPEAQSGLAFSLRAAGPARKRGLFLAGGMSYVRGSEFFQAVGRADDEDPQQWRAANYRRVGGTLLVGGDLSRTTRLTAEGRFDSIETLLPSVRTRDLDGQGWQPIDFQLRPGSSQLGALNVTLDLDTRSDPVMPAHGRRLMITLEAALPLFGSSYSYTKGLLQGSLYLPTPHGHVFALHGLAGAILGEAPFYARFFVADLNLLLPQRALGLNFATMPSRNLLGNDVSRRRYQSVAARALVEYAVPLWRGGAFAYRGDAFAAFGAFGLADLEDVVAREVDLGRALPIDLTGDLGLRLDTNIGVFTFSIANALGRLPF